MAHSVYDDLTWYEATARSRTLSHDLPARVDCDVCVIGGGLAGLTTTLELVRRGKTVVLLEAARVGSGASGRSGGFVSNGFALGVNEIARTVGLDAARELYALSRVGTAYVADQIAASDRTIRMGDKLILAVRHPDRGDFQSYYHYLKEHFDTEVLLQDRDQTRGSIGSGRYFSSLVFTKSFHIHPLRYVHLLCESAMAHGAIVAEQTRALAVTKTGDSFEVLTAKGLIRCAHVVSCVSSYDSNIHPPSGGAVLPVMTYVAVTEPLEHVPIKTSAAVADTRRAGDYYRLVDQDRLLWGGKITTRRAKPPRLSHVLRQSMLEVFPDLGRPRIDFAWVGQMGYALHKMPLIGRDQAGHWFATAFGGHGINTTAMAGVLIASAITEGDDTYRKFEAFAPRWAFGRLGKIGVQTSYWWMKAKDLWEEKRL